MTRFGVPLLVAIALLAGCARESGPTEVSPEDLPEALGATPAGPSPGAAGSVTIYLVRQGRLVAVPRATAVGPPVEAAMRALVSGPTTTERGDGLTTAIPALTELLEIAVEDGIALVDLSGEFETPAPANRLLLRLGQVVWTIGSLPGIDGVRLLVEGDDVAAVTDAGPGVGRAVTPADYGSIAPQAQ
jgi:germination protein M